MGKEKFSWNFSILYSPKENQAITAEELKSRFASANTVPGTQKYHSFVPSAELTLMLKKYSSSLECDVFPKKTVRQIVISKLFDSIFDVRGEGTHTKKSPRITN